jgi:spermidine synthase
MESSNASRRMFFVLFTVSGFSGLIYESIWSHYLKLFLGHAAYAQTLVLAIFMGGMAIGSWWVAARSTRVKNLLLGYAIVEGVIGFLGLTFHPLSRIATEWTFASVLPTLASPLPIQLFKWTLAGLLILPQSILLGMTFPLMSGAIVRRFPKRSGETLAMLYFTNSFGAAAGVLISGFVLIDKVGLPGTIMTAGLLNVALALFVWGVTKYSSDEPAVTLPIGANNATPAESGRLQRLILAGAFATGAAAFLYEIAWIRMLALVLGSSTHAFELMLSAFILGIALGGLWIRNRIQTLQDPVRTLGVVMLLMSAVALGTLHLYGQSFGWMSNVVRMFTPTAAGYVGFNLGSHAIALVLMVPTTFFCGLTLPIMTNVLLRSSAGERSIGSVYGWNTVGAIVGIVLAVHVIMPLAGVKAVMIVGGAVHAGLGLLFLTRQRESWRPREWGAVATASAALVAAIFVLQLDPRQMSAGVYRHGRTAYAPNANVLYYRDGKTASISLIEAGGFVSIATNGKPDAAIAMTSEDATIDEITMVLVGSLPLAIHSGTRSVANIGIGSGLSTHVLLEDPALTVVDTIEIEPFMVEAAKLGFLPHVRNTFEDARSHIHIEDAKTFFATQQRQYDVIVSEPSNPWVSGVSSLFSTEFYSQLKTYMKPDGLLLQWLQIYETDIGTVTSVLKALGSEFSDFELYRTDDTNILIVAVKQGLVPAIDGERLFAGGRKAALNRVGITTVRDVTARFAGNKAILMPAIVASGIPANSDYFPYVDQNAISARVMQRDALDVSMFSNRAVPTLDLLLRRPAPEGDLGNARGDAIYLDKLARSARALHGALLNKHDAPLDDDEARQFAMLSATAEQCRMSRMRGAWLDTAFSVASVVSPTLSRRDIEEFWTAVLTKPCAGLLEPSDRQFLKFVEAVSLRRNADVLALGRDLLKRGHVFGSPEQLGYASLATAVAAVAAGEAAYGLELLQALANDSTGARPAMWDEAILQGLAASMTAARPRVPGL